MVQSAQTAHNMHPEGKSPNDAAQTQARADDNGSNIELTPRWTPLFYHPKQDALWHDATRFIAVPAGRGSGKTELARRFLIRHLPLRKPWPDPCYFFGGPTYQQAKRVAWEDLKALCPPDWLSQKPSESELCIKTKFGSTLYVVGLDKPRRVMGKQWDGCVLDESSDLKPGTFDTIVLPALTHRNGWCWRIGVPKRSGDGALEYRKFYEMAAAHQSNEATGYTWPSSDILPVSALQYAREHMDPVDYREQFEASFEDVGSTIFHSFDRHGNVRPCQHMSNRRIVVGSDFNVDPMAWALGHKYNNRLEWFDEIWLRNANTQRTLDVLYSRYSHHQGGFVFIGDATGRHRETSASESDYKQILNDARFKRLGRRVFYPIKNPDREDRFASCNAMFCNAAGQRRMFVDGAHCPRLVDDLLARHRKKGTKEVDDVGDLGHISDAMGYPTHWLFPIRLELDSTKVQVIVSEAK